MTSQSEIHKESVRRMVAEVWDGRDHARLPHYWTGPSAQRALELVEGLTASFADLGVAVDDLVAEDDRVVAMLVFTGTHTGDFRGIAPTGRTVRFDAMRVYRFEDGLIVDSRAVVDVTGLLEQLAG